MLVLTGGPSGGKTTLIDELLRDPVWAGQVAALPEAIFTLRQVGISPREKLFQRVMVYMQIAMEDSLSRALGSDNRRLILCHRGSLDPLAYWLDQGWDEEEFFSFTGTKREELYRRYSAVIHLVTAADGAAEYYTRWPDAHRPETPEAAIKIDRLLAKVWGGHPQYYRIDNLGIGWAEKADRARQILSAIWAERSESH